MIEELKKYVHENKLHEKAIEDFWIAFNNWEREYPKEYAKKFKKIPIETLNVFVQTVGLRASQWPECEYSHATVTVWVEHKEKYLGKYTVWYSLDDSQYDDDFWEI